MMLKANIREAVRSLTSAKQRTLLALVGIVIGIGSVIAMVSVGTIVQNEALQQFKEMGIDIITIEKDYSSGADAEGKPGQAFAPPASFKLADVLALSAQIPSLSMVSPYTQGGGGSAVHQGKPLERASLMGVTAAFQNINKLHVSEGRFLSDLDAKSQFVVVGSEIGSALLHNGARQVVGERIKVGENLFTVMGVLDAVPQSGLRRFDPNTALLIHLTTALRLSGDTEISAINARVSPTFSNSTAREQVMAYFASYTKITARVSSPEDIIAQMEKQAQMFTLLLGAIGSISLVVGGVGVMNVMLVSVSERRREIGIRRALGAKRDDIKGQFLIESTILSIVGGLLGIVIGVGASVVICYFAHWQFVFSPGPILLGVGVSSAVGFFFGFYPARQAAQLDPIVALRAD